MKVISYYNFNNKQTIKMKENVNEFTKSIMLDYRNAKYQGIINR
jgi:hypothetical protein